MLKTVMEKILIVGAGLTGAASSVLIRQSLQKPVSISVWDKSKGIGGRMSTSRSSKDSNSTVDLGAQYISATPEYQDKHAETYSELLSNGVLLPLTSTIENHVDKEAGSRHYVTPEGISSLVKYFIKKADPSIGREHLVTNVSIETDKVKVTREGGQSDNFDAVVLTLPVPQILQLKGDITKLIDQKNIRANLEAVSYSSRFAVGLFFDPGTTIDVPWAAKYITDNQCIRFISVDNRKRGKDDPGIGPSLCVHTSVPWSLKNLEMDKDQAAGEIIQHLHSVIPNLPQPIEIKGHKWRYSQVHRGYSGSPGCVVLSESPAVILAGDAFTHTNMDGCLESAMAVQKSLDAIVQSKGKL